MEINLEKKHFALIAAMCIILVAGFVVANQDLILKLAPYSYVGPLPNPGHGGDTVWVDVPGSGEMTLQDAIAAGLFAGGAAFGEWQNTDSGQVGGTGLPLAKDVVYTAASDGFVVAYGNSHNTIRIESPNGTTRCKLELGHGNDRTGNMCPIRKGDTWKIWSNVAGALTIYWLPLVPAGGGSASLPSCADNQILKYSSASGSWQCADESGGGGASFGNWVLIGSNILGGTVYGPAATDGIVTAMAWDGHLQGYTDSTTNPTTMVIRHNLYHSGSGSGITMPVKKGHYWKVETQGGDGRIDALYWIPLLPGAPYYDFGGLYGEHENGSCVYTNPFTDDCTCPLGYNVKQILSLALHGKPASELFMCWR